MKDSKAIGRRKEANARVSITSSGTGTIKINKREFKDYFPRETLRMVIEQPLKLCGVFGKIDISANVKGSGLSAQAGAVRHGIARALLGYDATLRDKLKKGGFLTRDPRMKERKKYG
ncbi:MAG: 30S ribosomal protein S9, partial [Candidatus Omnitrophica bacterium]|nr:30S ribosomal protein S9 [Candidatus Omnitrophota bacterium]